MVAQFHICSSRLRGIKLDGDASAPGTSQYYGTDGSGTKGFYSLPAGTGDMILAATQTNTGAKTFNFSTLLDKGSEVFNVKAYGAVGNGVTDDTTAITAAYTDAVSKGGGIIFFPKGEYIISDSLPLTTGIYYRGIGSSDTAGSIIQQTTNKDAFLAQNNDVIQNINFGVSDLAIMGDYSENTQNGIYLQQLSNIAGIYLPFCYAIFDNLRIQGFTGAGKAAIYCESLIISRIDTCLFQECDNGLFVEGATFGTDTTISTSVSIRNCYANNCGNNGGMGYYVNNCSYLQFLNCACDVSNTSQTYGYAIYNSSSVSFDTCSVEVDSGAGLGGSMYNIESSRGVVLKGCYGYNANLQVIYVSNSSVTVIGFHNIGGTGATGFQLYTNAELTEIDCEWGTVTTVRAIDPQAKWVWVGHTRNTDITSSATPTYNVGASDWLNITALATNITNMSTNLSGTGFLEDGAMFGMTIKDNGTSRTLTWGSSFASYSSFALPTSTTAGKTLSFAFRWYDTAGVFGLLDYQIQP